MPFCIWNVPSTPFFLPCHALPPEADGDPLPSHLRPLWCPCQEARQASGPLLRSLWCTMPLGVGVAGEQPTLSRPGRRSSDHLKLTDPRHLRSDQAPLRSHLQALIDPSISMKRSSPQCVQGHLILAASAKRHQRVCGLISQYLSS